MRVGAVDCGTNSIRLLVAEKTEPTIVGYDQDEWARAFDYHSLPLEPSLSVVESVRGSTATTILEKTMLPLLLVRADMPAA